MIVVDTSGVLATRLGAAAAREFVREVVEGAYQLVDFDAGDVAAAGGILTVDERHFRTRAPPWGAAAFTLLPADS